MTAAAVAASVGCGGAASGCAFNVFVDSDSDSALDDVREHAQKDPRVKSVVRVEYVLLRVVPRERELAGELALDLEREQGVEITLLSAKCGPQPELDARVRQLLSAARARKVHIIRANRRVLDEIPRFRGSRLMLESQNPESGPESQSSVLDLWASKTLETKAYLDLTARSFGTFRTYSIPPGTTPRNVRDFFVAKLSRSWTVISEGDIAGSRVLGPMFGRRGRCLWFLIGSPATSPPGRSFWVATDLALC
jgi:hypothetical protein